MRSPTAEDGKNGKNSKSVKRAIDNRPYRGGGRFCEIRISGRRGRRPLQAQVHILKYNGEFVYILNRQSLRELPHTREPFFSRG